MIPLAVLAFFVAAVYLLPAAPRAPRTVVVPEDSCPED